MIIEVIRRLGHISKEMESFSAGRRHQWENIKKEIDDSDVVVVISASRYGTIFKDGLSFTESEIKYAKEKGKPLIPLLLANPTESKIDHKQKLKNTWNSICIRVGICISKDINRREFYMKKSPKQTFIITNSSGEPNTEHYLGIQQEILLKGILRVL